MIGNYPVTWLVTEILSVILLLLCMFHALKQPDYKIKLFELLCFIVGSAIFEHVGVLFTKTYTYDHHRIMMFGEIPLSTLMIEASIVYAAMVLFPYLNMPKWTSIWVVGFFSVFMDFSIDPVYINDQYLINGEMSGQWNWVFKYENTFFGIPFQNFTGWIYMTGFYAALIYLFRWLARKYQKKWLETANPFLSGLLLIVPLLVFGLPLIDGNSQRTPELVKLIAACAFAVILMIIYRKKMKPIDLKNDKIIFIVPALLQLYNIVVGFGLRIRASYIPVTICTILMIIYLGILYYKAKKAVIYSCKRKMTTL